MKITSAVVQKIAHLARLSVGDDETQSLARDLDTIFELVGKMNQTDIRQITALAHPLETSQPLRVDVDTEKNQRDLFLKNAPQSTMGLFVVPQVLDAE